MSPDQPGVAAPRDPLATPGDPDGTVPGDPVEGPGLDPTADRPGSEGPEDDEPDTGAAGERSAAFGPAAERIDDPEAGAAGGRAADLGPGLEGLKRGDPAPPGAWSPEQGRPPDDQELAAPDRDEPSEDRSDPTPQLPWEQVGISDRPEVELSDASDAEGRHEPLDAEARSLIGPEEHAPADDPTVFTPFPVPLTRVDELGAVPTALPSGLLDEAGVAPPQVRPEPAGRRRLLDDPDPDAPKAPRKPRVRARKVRRIVRHIEPWSVLKVSVLFFMSIFLIVCVASAVLWNAARTTGAIEDVESFITSLGFGNCEDIKGEAAPPSTTSTTLPGPIDQIGGGVAPSTTVAPADVPAQDSTLPNDDGECEPGQRLVGGFKFEDGRIFQAFALGGVVLVLAGAAGSVVLVLLFNLISDLTGGVRVTVLEEEPVPRKRSTPGSPGHSARG